MEAALSQTKWINAFCIHEAGHITYFRQLGVAEYDFIRPRIVYNSEKDDFDCYMAAVKMKSAPVPPNSSDPQQALVTLAKPYVAGKVFAEELTTIPERKDTGEEEDRQNFGVICRMLENTNPGIKINQEATWNVAEQEVRKDLRSPQFKTKAWKTVREVEKMLFAR